ncbi:hypothetical protein T10_6269 [Trichinella papuae]|uniref:Uncharacterized protein n=1 Tax=Trichinella papuae TaxID=268474 RepID=A0A0V1N1D2_9BILA|nr:hypothetical protein T10_6269 [Trichinella papuae]
MCNEIRLQDEVYANTTLSIAATPTGKDISLRCSRINLLQYTQNYGLKTTSNIYTPFLIEYLGRFLGKRGHLFRVLKLAMCQLYRPSIPQLFDSF